MKNKRKIQVNIRIKITVMTMLLTILLLCILIPIMFWSIEMILNQGMASNVSSAMDSIEENIKVYEGEFDINEDAFEYDLVHEGIYCRIKDSRGKVVYYSIGARDIFEYEPWILNDNSAYSANEEYTVGGEKYEISLLGDVYFRMVLYDLPNILYIIIPVYLIVATIGAYILARRFLKPISNVTATANKIKSGDWTKRIDGVTSKDEIGELAVTFNEMLDELETSYKRERQFTSDASHELRTPVSVVSACADEALNTDDEHIIRENLETIQAESAKMGKIISQLLTLSRGYEGKYHFEPECLNLRDTVDSVIGIEETDAEERSITIINNVPEEVSIVADQSLFTELLINLIGNAVKYDKDGGNVRIGYESDYQYKWIIIEDDGIGISEKDLDHIFERFYRADTARDRKGSGLGLAIVKWIVELHGGRISVSSTEGVGTEVRVGLKK